MKTLKELLDAEEPPKLFFTDEFECGFTDVDSLLESYSINYSTKKNIETLADDWQIICALPVYEKISVDVDSLVEFLSDENEIHEDSWEGFKRKVTDVLNKHIDFKKINEDMPTYIYKGNEKFVITKQDLLYYYGIN